MYPIPTLVQMGILKAPGINATSSPVLAPYNFVHGRVEWRNDANVSGIDTNWPVPSEGVYLLWCTVVGAGGAAGSIGTDSYIGPGQGGATAALAYFYAQGGRAGGGGGGGVFGQFANLGFAGDAGGTSPYGSPGGFGFGAAAAAGGANGGSGAWFDKVPLLVVPGQLLIVNCGGAPPGACGGRIVIEW